MHTALANRLSAPQHDRAGEAVAALEQWRRDPLTGTGPGTQLLQWSVPGGDGSAVAVDRYAHDEYLQVLWKTGAVGLALLGVWLAALGAAARGGQRAPLRAGCLAAGVALAVASALDFLWHVPLIPLVGVVLAGVATPAPPVPHPAPPA